MKRICDDAVLHDITDEVPVSWVCRVNGAADVSAICPVLPAALVELNHFLHDVGWLVALIWQSQDGLAFSQLLELSCDLGDGLVLFFVEVILHHWNVQGKPEQT